MVDVRATHFTAAELEELALPGLPTTKRGIAMRAADEGWARSTAPRRGNEAHAFAVTSLPEEARADLLRRAVSQPHPELPAQADLDIDARIDGAPDTHRAIAHERLNIVLHVADARARGHRSKDAIAEAAAAHGRPASTVRKWYELVRLAPRTEWFYRLLPNYNPHVACAPMHPLAWAYFRDDYLRDARPSYTSVYDRLKDVAKLRGWEPLPSIHAFRRRIERDVPETQRVLLRQGPHALERLYPAQKRDRSQLHALEVVNADGHKFDVLVRWPGVERAERPIVVAFQDVHSGKILSFRIAHSETADLVRLAFGDMVRLFGIPAHAFFDNGRAFAAKSNTGGTPNRYRFKVKEDEVRGLFTELGVDIHWTTPYHGQSKPIERAWRDLCDRVAKHPLCAGAYVGSNTVVKPESAGTHAVPLEDFVKLVTSEVVKHNAREGRTSDVCAGRSFDQAFEASYSVAPIRKATEAQLRTTLLPFATATVQSANAKIRFLDNFYEGEVLFAARGQKVLVHYDPDNLHRGLHVYRANTREYLGFAECQVAAGFMDAEAARAHASKKRTFLKAEKALAKAERTFTHSELGALHESERVAGHVPKAKVIAPIFGQPKPPRRTTPAEDIETAFAPTEGERALRERRAASEQLVTAAGQRALAAAPRRRTPL